MEVANIYDNGPISPIAKVKCNVAVWTDNVYKPFKIEWMEPIPASAPFVVDLCTVTGAYTALPANGSLAAQVCTTLQANDDDLMQFRWEPLDYVEGTLFELKSYPRFTSKGGTARSSPKTRDYDPWLATTSFWVLGINKDAAIGGVNLSAVQQPTCRFQFWGYRYVLSALDSTAFNTAITYLPAQGR